MTITLYSAGGRDPAGNLCVMNVIDLRWALAHGINPTEVTDYPECTARPVARVAQIINDRLSVDGKVPPEVAERLMARQRRIASAADLGPRVNVRIALAAAQWAIRHQDTTDERTMAALELVQRWLDGETVTNDDLLDAGHAARATADAAATTYAAAYAADAAATTYAAATAHYADAAADYAADAAADLFDLLDTLLDAHEKAAIAEGLTDKLLDRRIEVDQLWDEMGWDE